MARVCSFTGCTWPRFSKGLCRQHWQQAYGKTLRKVSKKGAVKKQLKKELVEQDKLFYLSVWEKQPHVCYECGCFLREPLMSTFHHLLYKSVFPEFRHCTWNIALVCNDCHNQHHANPDKTPRITAEMNRLKEGLL